MDVLAGYSGDSDSESGDSPKKASQEVEYVQEKV